MDFIDLTDATIKAIEEAEPSFKTVQDFESDLLEHLKSRNFKYPASLVVYNTSTFEPTDTNGFEETASLYVFVLDRNLRSSKASRVGARSGREKGVYPLLRNTIDILTNNKLDLPLIMNMTPQNVVSIPFSDSIAIYRIEFKASFDTDYPLK